MTDATSKESLHVRPLTLTDAATIRRLVALEAGERAEVRLVMEEQPEYAQSGCYYWPPGNPRYRTLDEIARAGCNPFGPPGTRLWVRETWAVSECYDSYDTVTCHCRWGNPPKDQACAYEGADPYECNERGRWRDASTMPRWASRIHLTVIDCKVEQVDGVWVWAGTVERSGES